MITNGPHASYNWFVQSTKNSINFEKILVVIDTLNGVTFLTNCVGNLSRKYDS